MNVETDVFVSSWDSVKNEWAVVKIDTTKLAYFGNTRSKVQGLLYKYLLFLCMIDKSIKYVWLELHFFKKTANFVYLENTVIRK